MVGYDDGDEVGGMGRGEVARLEVGCSVVDEGSSLGELDGTSKGEAARQEVEWVMGMRSTVPNSRPR